MNNTRNAVDIQVGGHCHCHDDQHYPCAAVSRDQDEDVSILRDEHGFQISKQTVHKIARDLCFRWTKPWYTDLLTPAQKLKRKIFCRELLRLTPAQLLNRIGYWLWTDEKWWDIVGPAAATWKKGKTKME